MLSYFYFFATGHQATFTSIKWESAFVGFVGDHDFYAIPVVMIALNTFASHVLCSITVVLIALWTSTRKHERGEFSLYENASIRKEVWKICIIYILLYALKVLSCLMSAGILRRHLMVWKIFAPRFVFEIATFPVVCLSVLFSFLLVVRTDNSLENYVNSLTKRY